MKLSRSVSRAEWGIALCEAFPCGFTFWLLGLAVERCRNAIGCEVAKVVQQFAVYAMGRQMHNPYISHVSYGQDYMGLGSLFNGVMQSNAAKASQMAVHAQMNAAAQNNALARQLYQSQLGGNSLGDTPGQVFRS